MTLARFKEINATLTCISEKDYFPNSKRINPQPKILSAMNGIFLSSRNKNEHLSIDESTIPFQGNLTFKVYNPNKPEKYGVKVYMLSSPEDGYIFKMRICSLSSTLEEIVCDLLSGFEGKFYKVFMDNFYNSFKMSKMLLDKKIYSCGTLRLRRGEPKNLVEIKKEIKAREIKVTKKRRFVSLFTKKSLLKLQFQ